MQKISRERFEWLKQKHYELWDWLSKNPSKYKTNWFDLDKNRGIRVANDCFACEFDNEINGCCRACPLICDKTNNKSCLGGLYEDYSNAKNDYRVYRASAFRDKVIELAKQIRDLPWSEEYVEDKEMNNENYIVINGKKAELTEEQLKQLGIEVGKNKRWRAEKEQEYFYVDTYNHVTRMKEYNTKQDKGHYDMHNYFKTKEEAQEYAEVLETERQLKKFADEHNGKIGWGDNSLDKYYLCYNYDAYSISIDTVWTIKDARVIYFSSEKNARQAIDEIGAENIIKYLTYNY